MLQPREQGAWLRIINGAGEHENGNLRAGSKKMQYKNRAKTEKRVMKIVKKEQDLKNKRELGV